MAILIRILNWSEVWALLIPLTILLAKDNTKPKFLKPIIIYLIIALIINAGEDIIDNYTSKFSTSVWLTNNNFLYNIHSIVRFFCFSTFFLLLKQPYVQNIKKYLPLLFLAFVIFNFSFRELFFKSQTISSTLFAIESGSLLFYCLQYYLYILQQDKIDNNGADFWVVIGLSIYVCINFPFFLLYTNLNSGQLSFWWNFHNISYIILCIFIAKAFYVSGNRP